MRPDLRNGLGDNPAGVFIPRWPGPSSESWDERDEMAKELPYFRWYPADAESDFRYSSLSLAERGLFHAAINCSWVNDGLPNNEALVGKALHLTVRELRVFWPKVKECFFVSDDGKLRNKRQEEERTHATQKSVRNAFAARSRSVRSANDAQHARARADSDSDSVSEYESVKVKKVVSLVFNEWWDVWSSVRGTARKIQAVQAWQSVVFDGSGESAIECTASYLASLDNPAKGFHPDNFIFEQAKDNFQARWPAFAKRNGNHRQTMAEITGDPDYGD